MQTTRLIFGGNASTASRHTSPAICYRSTLVTSAGLWLGDKPFRFSLPLLLTHMLLFVSTAQLIHVALWRFAQPVMVSQILGGVVYSPTLIGRDSSFTRTMFPGGCKMYLDTMAGISLMLFLFMIGVKTDLGMLRKSGKKAVAIGILGSLLPFGLLVLVGEIVKSRTQGNKTTGRFLFEFASTWSRTSYVVLSCILDELNLLNSKLGRIAMSGTLIQEFACTVLTSVVTSLGLGMRASTLLMGIGSFLSFVFFLAFIIFVVRPVVLWMIRRTPEGELLDETYFLTIIMMAFASGFIAEVIGHHATVGCFLVGLALPGGPPLGTTLDEKLSTMIVNVGIPVYMAMTGNRSDLTSMPGEQELSFLVMSVALGFAGKMVGVLVPCIYCKMPMKDGLILGLMLNCKGIFELYVLNNWLDGQLVDQPTYSFFVLAVLFFTCTSSPLVRYLYKPSMRYIAYKRRTIQHAKPDTELRLLVVVRSEDNVDPAIRLLDAAHFTRDTPVCVYLLHVLPLVGQTAAMLIPYKRHKPTDSDHIVNAFKLLEKRSRDTMVVQPFVSVAPLATMHDDVCSLALDKKVSLVLLPFHKHHAMDGTLESTTHAFRTMNTCVFDYGPCSVAVLINHGLLGGTMTTPGAVFNPAAQIEHIGMFFFGGPDDRESLSLASRMVGGDSSVCLTVVRFLPPPEWRIYGLEEKLDDEVVNEFRLRNVERNNVAYVEQVVKDGEETVAVIRSMKGFGLLIVGRRHGLESATTAGLSMWSEYPELGVVGDMLASTDYGNRVTTLVVQQQTKVASDQAGVTCHFGLGGGACYVPCKPAMQDTRL